MMKKIFYKYYRKFLCVVGKHEYEYVSGGALGKASAYYGEKCKYCDNTNITFFGIAYRKRRLW